jgi:peptide/nickel transport system substrate-binding protein
MLPDSKAHQGPRRDKGNTKMKRRAFLGGAAASGVILSAPAVRAQNARAKTLRLVPLTSLFSLDTVFNTSLVTTNYGFAVYDTLFGINTKKEISPQMAEGYTISDDKRTYTIKLRDGLKFHNGEPVRAQDCVQSLKRWAGRETFGQTVAQFVEDWGVADDKTIRIKLMQPVPIFLEAITRGSASIPFIMPEHVAKTDPYKQITESIGSGPWKFNAKEFAAGSFAAFTRNEHYVPRQEAPDWTSGGKVVNFDRMEWPTIPDAATAAAALQSGEVDWYEQVQPDLVAQLKRNADITIGSANPAGFNGILRFNHMQAPFNNVGIRRAVLMAVNQQDYMESITGNDPTALKLCKAMFPCGTPYGEEIGKEAMGANLDKARAMLKAAGYNNEKVVIISPADVPTIGPMGDVTYDLLKKMGMNVELVSVDWATLTTKRAVKESVDKGGWSIFHTWAPSPIISTPVEHFAMRGLGEKAWAGWYSDEKMEAMTKAWTAASTEEEQKKIAAEIQARAFEMVPFVLCGQFQIRTAYRKYLSGVVSGGAAYMWGVKRT